MGTRCGVCCGPMNAETAKLSGNERPGPRSRVETTNDDEWSISFAALGPRTRGNKGPPPTLLLQKDSEERSWKTLILETIRNPPGLYSNHHPAARLVFSTESLSQRPDCENFGYALGWHPSPLITATRGAIEPMDSGNRNCTKKAGRIPHHYLRRLCNHHHIYYFEEKGLR